MIDLDKFKKLRKKSIDLKSKKTFLIEEIEQLNIKKEIQELREVDCLRFRVILQNAAQKTQQAIENVISRIVTKALQSVFNKKYICCVEFKQARNKTECDIYLTLNGFRVEPLANNGGGLCDVFSTCLRIAFLFIDTRDPRLLLLLDEPFKFLHSPSMQRKCSEMISMLAEEFNLQMVIISDQENIIGDKEFKMIEGSVEEIS